jgi:FMN phosphatase YigB (HAD superfamily)
MARVVSPFQGRIAVHGILFDLDGTLLDIDIDAFLERYFAALARAMEPLAGGPEAIGHAMKALNHATHAMMLPHPGRTNQSVFTEDFRNLSGIDIEIHRDVFERFYAEEFPLLGDGFGPAPGAREAIEVALDLDLKVAIATNPIFPLAAVEHRIAWAGLGDLPVDAITTYETMHACKPLPAYFLETAERIGSMPERCLMVGDDRELDLPAAATGMRTYYVGADPDTAADLSGDLIGLAEAMPHIVREW